MFLYLQQDVGIIFSKNNKNITLILENHDPEIFLFIMFTQLPQFTAYILFTSFSQICLIGKLACW